MPNIALQIEYNGSAYHGFQRQENLATIQARLENAISTVAVAPITIIGAGRTDAGVHATAQMINFSASIERDLRAWSVGVNSYLPSDIAIRAAWFMPDEFHARHNAISRSYRYIINNHKLRHGLWSSFAAHYPIRLDHERMQQAANYLLGEQDFSAFRDADCQARSAIRKVNYCTVMRQQDLIFIDIQANAFLHHMVRNIVGTLVRVGRGLQEPEWINAVLASRDRRQAGMTMPAHALYFTGIEYPHPYKELSSLIWPNLYIQG